MVKYSLQMTIVQCTRTYYTFKVITGLYQLRPSQQSQTLLFEKQEKNNKIERKNSLFQIIQGPPSPPSPGLPGLWSLWL